MRFLKKQNGKPGKAYLKVSKWGDDKPLQMNGRRHGGAEFTVASYTASSDRPSQTVSQIFELSKTLSPECSKMFEFKENCEHIIQSL